MSHRTPKAIVAALCSTALVVAPLATSPAWAQRTEVGNAATVVGSVTMKVDGKGKDRKVQRKNRIAWGDLITTGKKSQLQILLLDRSTFGVGARTQLRIDRYVYNPNEERSFVSTLIKGALRFFSGRQDGAKSGDVNTPAGRIGIRGTAVDMLVGEEAEDIAEDEDFVGKVDSDKDEATLVVLRGPGANTEGGLTQGVVDVEGAGVVVTLDSPGLAAYIPRAGAAPIGPFRISDSGLADVQDELAPEVARAAKGGSFLEKLIPFAIGAITLGAILSGRDNDQSPPGTNQRPNPDTQQQPPRTQQQPPQQQQPPRQPPQPKPTSSPNDPIG